MATDIKHYQMFINGKHVDSAESDEIRDPATGKVLKTLETRLGDVTITQADDGSSTGTYAGTAPPKVGDAVETPQ